MRIRDWSSDVCSSELAEARLRERQVGGNAQHHRVVRLRCQLVEPAQRGRTHAGVDAGKDVEQLALALERRQRNVRQVLADQGERTRLLAGDGETAVDADRVAVESDLGHGMTPW